MADAALLPFADASFDGVWALESIFHVPDRARALAEIRRVMRPGARLALTDLLEKAPLDARQRGVVRALQVAGLARPGDHERLLAGAGLDPVESMDLSAAVRRSVAETIRATDAQAAALRAAYGDDLYVAIRRLLPELDALYAEKLGYVFLVARRPR
jgi:SAM-dependent methyltransferase